MPYPRTPPRLSRVFPAYPLYYISACTDQRRKILDCATVHNAFVDYAQRGAAHGVAVGRYVIMPDHLHLFLKLPPDVELSRWVGMLKRHLTRTLRGSQIEGRIWQRGFFDHVLRSSESYAQKWEYVQQNPVKEGLVKQPEEWAFAGEVVRIDRA